MFLCLVFRFYDRTLLCIEYTYFVFYFYTMSLIVDELRI